MRSEESTQFRLATGGVSTNVSFVFDAFAFESFRLDPHNPWSIGRACLLFFLVGTTNAYHILSASRLSSFGLLGASCGVRVGLSYK